MKEEPLDAEIVNEGPSRAVALRPAGGLPTIADLEQSFALAVRQRELLNQYIREQLVENKHFYKAGGSQKPSLTKEGAEIILLPHNLAPDYELVSGPEAPPEDNRPYQITVKCVLRAKGDAQSFVGSGLGSSGSHKQKRDGSYVPRQNDRYLCHNATMKMAQKSAMIAATINSTAASEFFTQDLEPESSAAPEPTASPPTKPKPKPERAPPSAEQCLAKFLKNLDEAGLREQATQYYIDVAWLMPNEPLDKMEERYIPRTKEDFAGFMQGLAQWKTGKTEKPFTPHFDGERSVPEAQPEPAAPEPVDHAGMESVVGTIQHVSEKAGTSDRGPWKLYGVKIADGWLNTFSDTLGGVALANKGKVVTVWYTSDDRGRTIHDIQPKL